MCSVWHETDVKKVIVNNHSKISIVWKKNQWVFEGRFVAALWLLLIDKENLESRRLGKHTLGSKDEYLHTVGKKSKTCLKMQRQGMNSELSWDPSKGREASCITKLHESFFKWNYLLWNHATLYVSVIKTLLSK